MKRLKIFVIYSVIAALLITLAFGTDSEAADQTARLKEFMRENHLYYSTNIVSLNLEHRLGWTVFREKYDDHCVVLTGEISGKSVSKNYKDVDIYTDSEKVHIDTSEKALMNIARQLKPGDRLTVYGSVQSIKKDKFEIQAEKALINSDRILPEGRYVYYEDDEITSTVIDDLTGDGHIIMNVPDEWFSEYVKADLKNNGVKGYQFFLNALAPQNTEYAEIFYTFYFDYATYLDPTPSKLTSGDREDIEELIIKNIVGTPEAKLTIDAENFSVNNRAYDYCATRYTVDGKTYRLEFMFRPDGNKGLICMLYLYFPREGSTYHLKKAAYTAGTLTIR